MQPTAPESDASLNAWLGKPVPRYTSYPPAPAFHAGVGAQEYAVSLGRLTPLHGLSLYLHIPFCNELCLYCGCNMTVTRREDRVRAYVDSLIRDMAQTAALIAPGVKVKSVHFGGGTPNALPAGEMRRVFAAMRAAFDLSECGEIAMEIDPRQSHEGQGALLAECGVTRVSLGVQDFDPRVQELIHRIQPYEFVERTCADLRACGIDAINFDLMYGLPLQTVESVIETARLVCALKPSRVALFSYAHVPQMKKHQKVLEPAGIPGMMERLAMDRAAHRTLLEAGYCEIGMDHFALPDDAMCRAERAHALHRNFQGYTTDGADALIGLGSSAISSTPDGFFQNERDIVPYQDAVNDGRLPVLRGILTTPEDRLRSALIEELMCYMSCDVARVCREQGAPVESVASSFPALETMREAGLISFDGEKISLLSPHRMAIRVVCHAFDRYAPASVASRAA